MIVLTPIFRIIGKIASYILYAATFLSAFGGYINPNLFTIPATMTLVLPAMAIASFLVAICWLIGRRWIPAALGIITIIACWGPLSMAIPLKSPKKASPDDITFSLVSYNVLHFDDIRSELSPENRSANWILETDADIVCLVECYSIDNINSPFENYKYTLFSDSLKSRYPYIINGNNTDISILSKYPVKSLNLPEIKNATLPKCYNVWEINIKGHKLTLAGVHLPTFSLSDDERNVLSDMGQIPVKSTFDEFKGPIRSKLSHGFSVRAVAARELISALQNITGPLIVCGDFNDVPASWTYRLFINDGFHDAFAETHFGPMYTYNAHLMYFHLDQVLYRGDIKALRLDRGDINSSDHYPLIANFAFVNKK